MRERTKHRIGAALGALVGAPIIFIASPYICGAFGVDFKPNPFLMIVLTVVFCGLAIGGFAFTREDSDGDGSS